MREVLEFHTQYYDIHEKEKEKEAGEEEGAASDWTSSWDSPFASVKEKPRQKASVMATGSHRSVAGPAAITPLSHANSSSSTNTTVPSADNSDGYAISSIPVPSASTTTTLTSSLSSSTTQVSHSSDDPTALFVHQRKIGEGYNPLSPSVATVPTNVTERKKVIRKRIFR